MPLMNFAIIYTRLLKFAEINVFLFFYFLFQFTSVLARKNTEGRPPADCWNFTSPYRPAIWADSLAGSPVSVSLVSTVSRGHPSLVSVVETKANGDSWSTYERGPSLVDPVVGTVDFCSALAALISPVQKIYFFLTAHFFTLLVQILFISTLSFLCVAISWLMFRNTCKGQPDKKCRVPPADPDYPWMQSYYREPDYSTCNPRDAIVYTQRTSEVSLLESAWWKHERGHILALQRLRQLKPFFKITKGL